MNQIIFKRKLYRRGSSYETTVPVQLLFALDLSKKHNVIFEFDSEANKWFLKFEEIEKEDIIKKIKKAEQDSKSLKNNL